MVERRYAAVHTEYRRYASGVHRQQPEHDEGSADQREQQRYGTHCSQAQAPAGPHLKVAKLLTNTTFAVTQRTQLASREAAQGSAMLVPQSEKGQCSNTRAKAGKYGIWKVESRGTAVESSDSLERRYRTSRLADTLEKVSNNLLA